MAPTGNPVVVGGRNGSGQPQAFLTDAEGRGYVRTPGRLVTLYSDTVDGDGTTNGTPVTDLDAYLYATLRLIIANKSLAGGGTVDLYLQYSPDGGTTWDDLVHFDQIANAAVADGTYISYLNAAAAVPFMLRAATDGTLGAGLKRDQPWADRMRVKVVAATFDPADTVDVALVAYMQ